MTLSPSVERDNEAATRRGGEVEVNPPRRGRDHRVDAMRGLALLMMFVDHIPQNLLNRLTLHNVGFADAAEIFVMLAGFASWIAYGNAIERHGWREGVSRIVRRCAVLYLYQFGLLLLTVLTIRQWRRIWPLPPDAVEPELAHGSTWLWKVLTLDALPNYLNILPLYIVLLLLFPVIYALLRRSLPLGLGISAAVWLLINVDPDVNLPNWLDPDGWYFDPFAWQFLFTLGACGAILTSRHGGSLPRRRWLTCVAWVYLAFSALESFPWTAWGLPDLRLFPMGPPEKTSLSPVRLIDVLSIFYLVESSRWARRASEGRLGQLFARFGRHSLEIFATGTVLDLYARLAFSLLGASWWMQMAVNVVSIALLYGLSLILDARRKRASERARVKRQAPTPTVSGTMA
ncbi:hypothetical protein AA103196_0392 [Ameyamaea chiangmaiensis NBRC 103196]|uniref:OpgC domain-containing protein n=1 Tax=Ameyamaea chiangmaiensis TaxID=442969 RepID=A0A850PIQ2_9PROT|nr:OpgC domain-containing protein [Ameyamaea chiangmaiensis]MBS4074788.1 OpgC domain-containing protein [Ameyamaea chiangmaiensis]NVN41682.1 OpgC domain-containing protein [Ameyamaea chiangmaiensis]GBQ62741.1 hypothetical protein AA103196_0392 [Ameyamaea chiangmaiensis NBRC 103196]